MVSGKLAVRPAVVCTWQKLKICNFLGQCKYDKCQTLHDDGTHWALSLQTTLSDLIVFQGHSIAKQF